MIGRVVNDHAGILEANKTKRVRPSLMANRFWFLEIEVSAPSQAYLNRETGESGPLFLKSHQSFCERHATPFAVSSGQHFEKLSIHSSSLYSVSDAIYLKKRPFFRLKRRYIYISDIKCLVDFFFLKLTTHRKNLERHPRRKQKRI